MTQPTQAPANAEVEEEDESKPASVADLLNEIVALSGVDPDDVEELPTGRRYVTPKGAVWALTLGVPGRVDDLLVIGLFLDDRDVRVYCLPKRAMDESKPPQPLTPTRFTLSRLTDNGSPFAESMPLETLCTEMAEEIADLYGVVGSRMREDCPSETCGASNEANARFCSECGVKMPEDEEEPVPPPPPPPPPATRPS